MDSYQTVIRLVTSYPPQISSLADSGGPDNVSSTANSCSTETNQRNQPGSGECIPDHQRPSSLLPSLSATSFSPSTSPLPSPLPSTSPLPSPWPSPSVISLSPFSSPGGRDQSQDYVVNGEDSEEEDVEEDRIDVISLQSHSAGQPASN